MEVCFYFRVLCFRFYFVGDEDLLEIIGNSKNVPRLQKHFKKMFAGVHSVILSDDQTKVLGISAKEGEQVILHISSLPPSPPSSPSPLPLPLLPLLLLLPLPLLPLLPLPPLSLSLLLLPLPLFLLPCRFFMYSVGWCKSYAVHFMIFCV